MNEPSGDDFLDASGAWRGESVRERERADHLLVAEPGDRREPHLAKKHHARLGRSHIEMTALGDERFEPAIQRLAGRSQPVPCQWPFKTAHIWPLKSAQFFGAATEGA